MAALYSFGFASSGKGTNAVANAGLGAAALSSTCIGDFAYASGFQACAKDIKPFAACSDHSGS